MYGFFPPLVDLTLVSKGVIFLVFEAGFFSCSILSFLSNNTGRSKWCHSYQ